MGRANQGQTQSDQVDHQETQNRTHDGDDLTPATLEATNSITDPSGTSHNERLARYTNLIDQKERINQLRLDFALDGVGLKDAFSETFVDSTNIVDTAGINIATGVNGYAEVADFIDINEVVTDGQSYSYNAPSRLDLSALNVSVTGQDNTVTETASGTLSSGTSESVEVVSDKPPANEEITLSAAYNQTNKSISGSGSGSFSETINPDGSLSVSDATINLQGVSSPTFDNRGDERNTVSSTNVVTETYQVPEGSVTQIGVKGQDNVNNQITFDWPDGSSDTINYDGGSNSGQTYYRDINFDTGGEISISYQRNTDDWWEYQGLILDYESSDTVTVDGSDYTADGSLTKSISSGSETIYFNVDSGTVNYDISWSETNGVADISGTVGSSTISQSGPLTNDLNKSVDLSDGSNQIDLTYSGSSDSLDYDLRWDETTETADPSVTINGNTQSYSGTLTDGTSTSLTYDTTDIVDGTNNLSISLNDSTGGPQMKANLTVEAVTDTGVVELGTFNTDYVIEEMVGSNTIENGTKADVNMVVEDANGNTFVIDDSNIDTFVEPPFDGQDANVTLELLNYGPRLTEISLFTEDTVGT